MTGQVSGSGGRFLENRIIQYKERNLTARRSFVASDTGRNAPPKQWQLIRPTRQKRKASEAAVAV
jgi:hypothetical protein